MGNGIAKCFQLLVRRLQLSGAFLHSALKLSVQFQNLLFALLALVAKGAEKL